MLLARDLIVGISIPSSISLPTTLFTRSVMHHPATNSLFTFLARHIMMCITETPLRSITNIGTWMLILAPTYSTKIFIGRTVMTTYIIPFVIGMLLARDSIVGGNDTYGITGIPSTVGGRGVVRRASPGASTRIVYPGSGREDAKYPIPAFVYI